MRIALPLILASLLIFSSCKERTINTEEHFEYEELKTENNQAKEVIYSMYLPTDMAEVFSHAGANYDENMAAPIDNLMLYNDHEQLAIMLGVLGVDLLYMKLLGQNASAAQYYKAIENLASKIDIPDEVFKKSAEQMEHFFNDEDSLAVVIENIYKETDLFFKENNKDNLTALSLVGGWVEAMYIGAQILNSDINGNQMMAERLLQQKYTLNSIYTILSNHQESLAVKGYLLMLKKLRKTYETVDIRYQKEGFSVDTTQKKLTSFKAEINYEDETLNELTLTISQIREELIKVSSAE